MKKNTPKNKFQKILPGLSREEKLELASEISSKEFIINRLTCDIVKYTPNLTPAEKHYCKSEAVPPEDFLRRKIFRNMKKDLMDAELAKLWLAMSPWDRARDIKSVLDTIIFVMKHKK